MLDHLQTTHISPLLQGCFCPKAGTTKPELRTDSHSGWRMEHSCWEVGALEPGLMF